MARIIEIQLRDKSNGHWDNVAISKIKNDIDQIVMGRTFRILVDGEPIYQDGNDRA